MKVWTLEQCVACEGNNLVGVYSSKEKLREAAQALSNKDKHIYELLAREIEVDSDAEWTFDDGWEAKGGNGWDSKGQPLEWKQR